MTSNIKEVIKTILLVMAGVFIGTIAANFLLESNHEGQQEPPVKQDSIMQLDTLTNDSARVYPLVESDSSDY